MDKSTLIKYINGDISANEFSSITCKEVSEYEKKLSLKGTSVHINIINDFELLEINNTHYNIIYNDLIENHLDKFTVSFIVDCLLISNNSVFESDELIDELEALSIG